MGNFGQSKIEVREVDQDNEIGFLSIEGLLQSSKGFHDRSYFGKDFRNPNDSKGLGVVEEFHPPPSQLLPTDPKKLDFRIDAADGFHQIGAMEVS
jgi:hypothetical protein